MSNIEKSEQQWRQQLSAEEFHICREKGTERAFSGQYNATKTAGTYRCTCCGEALFDSESKYDSGSGWPSFFQPITADSIAEQADQSLGMVRVEVMCRRCGSHLGHKFEDGPAPTGLRYCVNSASLKLDELSR